MNVDEVTLTVTYRNTSLVAITR